MNVRGVIVLTWAASVLACAAEEAEQPPPPATASCVEPELALPDGSCIRPGVAAEGCGVGFIHDGAYGCSPDLPTEACPNGLMALPGETLCRPIVPCAEGKWGDIPVDASTIYVDGAYLGTDSDGSAAKPYGTIGAAVTAAPSGALIAVTEGSYVEDVIVQGKSVRLWAVCPEKVEWVGTGSGRAALDIRSGANATEAHRFAIRGGAIGISLSGSVDVLVEETWVHDNANRGINMQGTLGATSLRVRSSLVEQNRELGVYAGADIALEDTVVRRNLPVAATQNGGRGINIASCTAVDACASYVLTKATIVHSVFEDNLEVGVHVGGADVTIDSTLVRNTWPRASDQEYGIGVVVGLACTATGCDAAHRPVASIVGSIIDHNHLNGMDLVGADATVDSTVVRGTQSTSNDGRLGAGIAISLACVGGVCDPSAPSVATVRNSLVEQNHSSGIYVLGAEATLENNAVRETQPQAADQHYGNGITVGPACGASGCAPTRARVTVKSSLLERNHTHGLLSVGADAIVENSIIRETLPEAALGLGGRGLGLQLSCFEDTCDPSALTNATVRNTLVERNHEAGILVFDSLALIEATVIRNTEPVRNDLFGDGLAVVSAHADSSVTLTSTFIDATSRAGISSFGAFVSVGTTRVRCAAIPLSGESYENHQFNFEDRGGNTCGCPDPDSTCKAISAGLQPPDPPTSP